jgi:hemolysin activation/secretion protein
MVKPQGEGPAIWPVDRERNVLDWARDIGAAIVLLGAACPAAPVMAQSPANLRLVPQGSPIPRILPPESPSTAPALELPALPPPSAEVPDHTVRVADVSVDGVTAFPSADMARYTQDLTGPAVPLSKIDATRQAILQQYRSAGYVLSTVSANVDAGGHLRFIVTEGRIASVKLDGDIGPAGVQVLRFLMRLTQVQPIDSATLERYLLLAQDVPGVKLRAVLQPSAEEPGALTLIAQVSRQAISGLATFDNRAFDQTGPNEGLGVIDFNSFTEFGEKSEVTYYHSFPDSQNFGQLNEEMFLGSSGLKFRVYAGIGNAIPTGGGTSALSALNYHATTSVLGDALSYPLIRSRQQTLNLFGALDALETNVRTGANGAPLVTTNYDSLRMVRLGVDYASSDLWLGANRSAVNSVTVRLSQGLHLLGAEDAPTAADAARQNEQSNFTKINFEAIRTQTLFTPWAGTSVALMALLTGQWTNDVLPPVEQFYLGGSQFTRGYYAGQVPGDKALAATTELQFNTGANLSMLGLASDAFTQFYLFYDWGETWQNQSTDFATKINSAGGGVRMQLTPHYEVDLEGLGRFNRYPTGSGSNVSALNGIGLYWRVVGRF